MKIYMKHGRLRTNKGILQCRHIKTVARARHYCDVVRDHCQQGTKQNTLHESNFSKIKLSDI